jgi:hypothetical protein
VTPGVSRHALEVYQLFYPDADEEVLLGALSVGLSIPNAIALKMVGRRSPHRMQQGSYVLHVERTGIFVLSDPRDGRMDVITFLRFYSIMQHRLAVRLFPQAAAPPTANAAWVRR